MQTLASELGIPIAGAVESLGNEGVPRPIQQLERRAVGNLIFVRRLSPYAVDRRQGE